MLVVITLDAGCRRWLRRFRFAAAARCHLRRAFVLLPLAVSLLRCRYDGYADFTTVTTPLIVLPRAALIQILRRRRHAAYAAIRC